MDSNKREVNGENNEINIDGTARFERTLIHIEGNHNVLNVAKNCIIFDSVFFFEGDNCEISLREDTQVVEAGFIVFEKSNKIVVGKGCSIARGVKIRTSDSHSIIDLKSKKRINPAESIYIGDHVWICEYCQILKGVRISDNSIIALGTILTKDVPGNCVVGGSPNRILRKNITWDRELII